MKPKGLIGCVLVLVLFALSGAEGAAWEKIGDKTRSIYVDKQSITTPAKDTVRASIKVEVRAKEDNPSGDPKRLREFVSHVEYDCGRQHYHILGLTMNYMDGTSKTVPVPYGDIRYTIVPDTAFEIAFNYLCK